MYKTITQMESMKQDKEPVWIPYEHYKFDKLYYAAREYFLFNRGAEYSPSREEIEELMNNPDFIKSVGV